MSPLFLPQSVFPPPWKDHSLSQTLDDCGASLLLMLEMGLSYLLALVTVSVKWRYYILCKVTGGLSEIGMFSKLPTQTIAQYVFVSFLVNSAEHCPWDTGDWHPAHSPTAHSLQSPDLVRPSFPSVHCHTCTPLISSIL